MYSQSEEAKTTINVHKSCYSNSYFPETNGAVLYSNKVSSKKRFPHYDFPMDKLETLPLPWIFDRPILPKVFKTNLSQCSKFDFFKHFSLTNSIEVSIKNYPSL